MTSYETIAPEPLITHLGKPLAYGTKVAARFIARANVCPGEWPGIWNAVNHDVGGYMSGLEVQSLDNAPEQSLRVWKGGRELV